jgi:hypothetical protein
MPYETFDLRFEKCEHIQKIPLQHNADDSQCYICHPELRDRPLPGKCPECMSAENVPQQGKVSAKYYVWKSCE